MKHFEKLISKDPDTYETIGLGMLTIRYAGYLHKFYDNSDPTTDEKDCKSFRDWIAFEPKNWT